MADQKISQLLAASPLTGAELIELVQGGANVQSTAAAVAAVVAATPASINTIVSAQNWFKLVFNGQSAAIPTLASGQAYGTTPANWGNIGGFGSFGHNPAATSIWLSLARVQHSSAAAINSAVELFNSNANTWSPSIRKASGGAPVAGFSFTWFGSFVATKTDQTVFVGLSASPVASALGGSLVPSAMVNAVGFGKDTGDANLQFMVNNGAGSAAKTDTGVTMASIQGHFVSVTISCDTVGALITATLTDYETGGIGVKTFTVADGATKNPVVDVVMGPHIYAGTGPTTGTAVTLGQYSIFTQTSMLQ